MEQCLQRDQQPTPGRVGAAAYRSQQRTSLWQPGTPDTTAATGITPMLERSFTMVAGGGGTRGGHRRFGTSVRHRQLPAGLSLDCGNSRGCERPAAEKAAPDGSHPVAAAAVGKRRPVSPDSQAGQNVKRSKSVTDEAVKSVPDEEGKTFDEPPWE
jgi:hypothetical protein